MSVKSFLSRFFDKFFKDDTTTLAASLAFYTALSLAPTLILFVAIAAHLSEELITELLNSTQNLVGADAAQAVQMVIEGAKSRADLTSFAGLLGALTLLASASLIFGQLRTALNRIFEVPAPTAAAEDGLKGMIVLFLRERLAFILLAFVGVLSLIASLLASSVLSATVHTQDRWTAVTLNVGASTAFYALVFSLVFRYLPDARQPWPCALRGGVLTALMFEIGKELIAVYLGRSAVGSAYGAAGSLIVLLVWVYYSTLISLIGAQLSSIWMRMRPNSSWREVAQ